MKSTSYIGSVHWPWLAIIVSFISASLGLDISFENANACSYPSAEPYCFVPERLDETTEAPGKPKLLAARIESISYDDGCGSNAGSCADIRYDSVEFIVQEQAYDDVDELGMMGLIIRADSDYGEQFVESLTTKPCAQNGALHIYAFENVRTDIEGNNALLKYTIDPPQYSGPGGIDVSIAFVDQNGNIGPYSEPVQLEKRAVVY